MKESLNALTEAIIGAALEVHRELGPGLLENAYESCLAVELLSRGFNLERQKALPVVYKNQRVDCGYRLDLVVEGTVIVEIKAVETPGASAFSPAPVVSPICEVPRRPALQLSRRLFDPGWTQA